MRHLLALAGVVSAVAGAGPSGPGVHTLYRDPSSPITAFAQDGNLLAWFSRAGSDRCNSVHVLSLGGAQLTLPKPGTRNVTCRWSVDGTPVALAVAAGARGTAVLWTLRQQASVDLDYVVGAQARAQRERRFTQLAHTRAGAGLWLGGIAGDGNTLVYGWAAVGYVDQRGCLAGGSCRQRVARGGVRRVVGRRTLPVPGAGPALEVAASDGRLAYVRAGGVAPGGRPLPRREVEVRRAADGALLARIAPRGTPLALALSSRRLAVLARARGRLHVSWYALPRARLLGTVAVPTRAAPELSASDSLVVFHVGRVIEAVDLASHRVHELVRAAAPPVGLSLEGTRVAWAENLGAGARIRALVLSPPR